MSSLVPQGIYCVGIPAPLLAQGMTELSHSELRVLLYIYLHTLGYQKSADSLTYNQMIRGIVTRDGKQLDKGAGVSRRSLVEALAGLEKKGYIKRQTGANSASTKIVLCFSAPEFQGAVVINTQPTDNQPEQQLEAKLTGKQCKKQIVQKTHLPTVQLLHPSYKNQHVLNHGDEKTSSKPDNPNQTITPYPDCLDYQPGVDYLLQHIPNLAKNDAQELVQIALIDNGHNLNYLQQLTGYVLSNPRIHTPAAVLAKLVKNNSQRLAPVSHTGKITKFLSTNRAVRIKTSPEQPKTFPYASKYLAQQTAPVVGLEVSRENSNQLATNTARTKPKRQSKKNQNTKAPLAIQDTFDWGVFSSSEVNDVEEIGSTLPVSRVTPFEAKVTVKPVILDSHALFLVEQTPHAFDTALARMQNDIAGRLRYSVSPHLENALKTAKLELVRGDKGGQFIEVKFEDELATRLLTQQDCHIIKLSLRQSLGNNFAIVIGDGVMPSSYTPTRQSFNFVQAV